MKSSRLLINNGGCASSYANPSKMKVIEDAEVPALFPYTTATTAKYNKKKKTNLPSSVPDAHIVTENSPSKVLI